MKILYITEIFPDPRTGLGYWGGGERQVYEVARRVAKKGHQVTVLTCQFPGQGEYDTLEGIRVIREGLSRNQRTGGALLSISKVADYLARTIGTAARIDADIVHCNAYYPVIAGRAISTFRGVPMVSTFHDLPAPEAWESYTRSYAWSRLGYLATLASACLAKGPVLAVSENARAKLARVSVKGIQVIPNGVDLDLLDSAKTPRNEKQVLYVGRLVKYKGVGDLIAAFGEVLSKIDSARLVIVGDGPERKALETMAASLPPGSVVFTGTLPSHQQVAELYR
ncbi:MAG TPA: glycosyltransferase family 4 protein, partial [Nitrososphaerales archaeon]|nr:glycosyltransferase family 4 protein [Nitrososphaerales archaeon]